MHGKIKEPRADGSTAPSVNPAAQSDGDLLASMALAGEEPLRARAAWEEFYRRHAQYLYAVCLRAYGRPLGGDAGACDLVAETFRRAYEKAGKFDAGGVLDAQRLSLRARAWLGRIAQRLAQSALRGRGRLRSAQIDLAQWQEISREPAPACQQDEPRLQAVREALAALNEKEQLVIRVTMQWYRAGEEHQRLPDDVCQDLAGALGTTPENLRQIRRRAMHKLQQRLSALQQTAREAP